MKFFIPRVFCLEWIKKMAVLLCGRRVSVVQKNFEEILRVSPW